jgi:crotonobetainyl-CoA hydratase
MVVADHAEMGLPEARLGIVPDSGGLLRLPRLVPPAVATELVMTGRRLSAAEAARWGLANDVVPAGGLVDRAMTLARSICESAPLAIAAVKEIRAATECQRLDDAYATLRTGDLPAYRAMLRSADAEEGPRAFAERRAPRWKGE